MRGDLERRLLALDKQLPKLGTLGLAGETGLPPEEVYNRAVQHLTVPELKVLLDLLDLRTAYPDISGAAFYDYMTDLHKAVLSEWRKVTRNVVRQHIEGTTPNILQQRKEELMLRNMEELQEAQPHLAECPEKGERL